ncbi:MAG TPA: YoaK family protein, partial [Terrimicrobium sp.]
MQAPKLLIYILASVGGLVDAVGLLVLGHLFTAHMSGNSAALGAYFGQGYWSWGTPHLFAIPVFVLGIVAGHLWLAFAPGARGASFLLLIEAALLAIFAIVHFFGSPGRDTLGYFALCLLPLLAMGIQNAPTRTI